MERWRWEGKEKEEDIIALCHMFESECLYLYEKSKDPVKDSVKDKEIAIS